jgi:arsenate reductase (thioredoxin)
MADPVYNVLFLCTGNSARSIMAEGILNKDGRGRFRAFSAGSHPKGSVNPFALKVLASFGCPAEGFRSKDWEEFATPGAPVMDFVFTVCDDAAGEVCPVWPGQPMTAHWGIEDPAAVRVQTSRRRLRSSQPFAISRTGFPSSWHCRSEASTGWPSPRSCGRSAGAKGQHPRTRARRRPRPPIAIP